jgi:uncharacterized protein (DUF305 family)
MAISPTGDADRDIVNMMVPSHRGAIDMAKDELKHSHSELVATQQKEITVIRNTLSEGPSAAPQSASINGSVSVSECRYLNS